MMDREKAGLRGPVRTVRTEREKPASSEIATYDPQGKLTESVSQYASGQVSKSVYLYDAADRLREIQHQTNNGPVIRALYSYSYDRERRLERESVQGPDGTDSNMAEYRYEADGRKQRLDFAPPRLPQNVYFSFPAVEGLDQDYGATGAATRTTVYDPRGKPVEILFHNEQHTLLPRVTLAYDAEGRLLEESIFINEFSLDQPSSGPEPPPEQKKALEKALARLFGPQSAFSRTTYVYDERGRCAEKYEHHGDFGVNRTTFVYDEYGNKTEETHLAESREFEVDDDGNIVAEANRQNTESQLRFEYEYDQHGNWTKRVTFSRRLVGEPFEVLGTETREITYHPVPAP